MRATRRAHTGASERHGQNTHWGNLSILPYLAPPARKALIQCFQARVHTHTHEAPMHIQGISLCPDLSTSHKRLIFQAFHNFMFFASSDFSKYGHQPRSKHQPGEICLACPSLVCPIYLGEASVPILGTNLILVCLLCRH